MTALQDPRMSTPTQGPSGDLPWQKDRQIDEKLSALELQAGLILDKIVKNYEASGLEPTKEVYVFAETLYDIQLGKARELNAEQLAIVVTALVDQYKALKMT